MVYDGDGDADDDEDDDDFEDEKEYIDDVEDDVHDDENDDDTDYDDAIARRTWSTQKLGGTFFSPLSDEACHEKTKPTTHRI
eukprot:4382993-Amphidinium_carterae.1